MASSRSSYLRDIDEKFCQCSICLQQYREPKLLPCLHRYCSDCLKQLIDKNQGVTVISCPECRDEVTIPTEGVDGFKTDFYMKNIVEYIQIKESLGDHQLRECYNCYKISKVTAFCFKCNGFLCYKCHEIHMTGRSLKDHKQHTLTLEDLKSKHMTLEKLSDMKEAPRCQSHLNDLCLLCCRTCNELPICVTCVHGRHKNHDINDVGIIAAEEREKLQNEMKNLNQYKQRMMKMPEEVERAMKDIIFNFREREDKTATRFETDMKIVQREIEKITEDCKQRRAVIENNKEKELTETRKQMDEEMNQIKKKYDRMFDNVTMKCELQLHNLRKEIEGKDENKREQLAILKRELKRYIDAFAKEKEARLAKLEGISQQIESITRRYENLTATGNSVLETRYDWTAVRCIPNICKAIETLREDMEKEIKEFVKLSRISVSVQIEENEESPVEIKTDGLKIFSITVADNGSIVITGSNTSVNYQSHITVINMNGKVLHRQELKGTNKCSNRFCTYLSEFKIATVCWDDEIGVFDVHDYSYIKKNIHNVIKKWPLGRVAHCVTTDLVNNHILVGNYDNRDVYVFDNQLNYHHKLTLPEIIKHPYDMASSEELSSRLVLNSSKKRHQRTKNGKLCKGDNRYKVKFYTFI